MMRFDLDTKNCVKLEFDETEMPEKLIVEPDDIIFSVLDCEEKNSYQYRGENIIEYRLFMLSNEGGFVKDLVFFSDRGFGNFRL